MGDVDCLKKISNHSVCDGCAHGAFILGAARRMTILHGDCLEHLRQVPDGYFQTCVTSPPYWGLRDYGADGQLGLEKTPDEYVQNMVRVFREVRRVLKVKGAHFATFPPDLIEPCILAGSAFGDYVLDPFAGAGTTGLVAERHGRQFVGIELNSDYVAIAEKRISGDK